MPSFASFAALKKHIEASFRLSFCDICLAGRKVFICEQLVYDKQALEQHQRSGDQMGPLAESGFTGARLSLCT